MEASPGPWISSLRHSHDRLRACVEPLGPDQLEQRSYASEVVDRAGGLPPGLPGRDLRRVPGGRADRAGPPGRDEFVPIWNLWNAKSPQAQAADGLRADQATLERFESLDADQQARLHLHVFGMDLDAAGLARMRVGEHAVHTWDIAVALDPAATVAPDAVALLVDTLGQLAARTAEPDGKQRKVRVLTATRAGSSPWRRGTRSRSRRRTTRPRPSSACRSCGCRRGVRPPGLRAPRPRAHPAGGERRGGPGGTPASLPGF